MKKNIIILFFLMSGGAAFAQTPHFIQVTGVGEIAKAPDQAIVQVSIEVIDTNALKAKEIADNKYQQLIDALLALKLQKKHLKTTTLTVHPVYDWQKQKRVYQGEKVFRALSITVNNVSILPQVIQTALNNGVSRIENVKTDFQDPKKWQQAALNAAVIDAKTKAEFLAQQLGRKLGQAYQVIENNVGTTAPSPHFVLQKNAAQVSSNLGPSGEELTGEIKQKAVVNIHFLLETK